MAELDVEAGIPVPLPVRGAGKIRDFLVARTKAGRTGQRAVGAGKTPLSHRVPARVLQIAHEQRRHRGGIDAARLPGGDALRLRAGSGDVIRGGRLPGQLGQQLAPDFAAGLDQEAVSGGVDQLREHQIVTTAHRRPGIHRAAKTGVGRHRAVDRHQQHRLAPRRIGRIDVLATGKHPVLHADGRQLAGAHADEGAFRCLDRLRLEIQPAVVQTLHRKQRLPGREQVAFPRVRPDGVAEHCVIVAPRKPVAARRLLVGPAGRQLGHRIDAVVDDGAVPVHRPDDLVAAPGQRIEQRLQAGEVDQLHGVWCLLHGFDCDPILAREAVTSRKRARSPGLLFHDACRKVSNGFPATRPRDPRCTHSRNACTTITGA